ncbi:MAG: acetyl-CoA synthetase [Planctomycetota bacterium]|nr:MAG: acetyl-CoA synthetase [Planctomycetota bacterium]
MREVTAEELEAAGASSERAAELLAQQRALAGRGPEECWLALSRQVLRRDDPFPVHLLLFEAIYHGRDPVREGPPIAWAPGEAEARATNAWALAQELGLGDFAALWRWSADNREEFWRRMIARLGIRFETPPEAIVDLSQGVERPRWLVGARMNIAASCFGGAADAPAVIHQRPGGPAPRVVPLGELQRLAARVAHGLVARGLGPGDAVGVCMPMTLESVAIYLGIVQAGLVCVSIADSFSPAEIAVRNRLGGAKAIFTQDVIRRGGRTHGLLARVHAAASPPAIVIPGEADEPETTTPRGLGPADVAWSAFLSPQDRFEPLACDPGADTNVLFSSGTTGEPKAIPWSHTTPIKCAADAHLHHDTHPGDVLCWPTNLGWMMGPWLIYASLIHRAALALYEDAPLGPGFAAFVERAGVTMLGVVPSLVRSWRESDCVRGADWSRLRLFSSTGECSNPEDMLWLMAQAGYRPVIEYCGGTEIGGGYITGSLWQPAAPATFSTPAVGLDLVILDEQGRPARSGELFVVPPSIGLSVRLLNRDHHEVYYAGCPRGPRGEVLRRHGDHMERLGRGYFRALGRIDDTMNLGGIKVSSAEIERVLAAAPEVRETAAIAVPPPGGGPSRLVVYAVLAPGVRCERDALREKLGRLVREELNPLFKLHDVVIVPELPRTASNKVMRRVLRERYAGGGAG